MSIACRALRWARARSFGDTTVRMSRFKKDWVFNFFAGL